MSATSPIPNQTKLGRRDVLLAAVLLFSATIFLQLKSRSQGFTRDEGYYFHAAEMHVAYLEASWEGLRHGRPLAFADRALIDRWLSYNSEHPPLMKTLFGLSWRLLHRCDCPNEAGLHPISYTERHRTLGWLKQGEAMRLPAHLLTGILIAAVYLFGMLCFGRMAGLIGAAFTLFLPRLFFHAQLACFDVPVAAMIFLITFAYRRFQLAPSKKGGVLFGVLLGLGLLTKHNTFFLPFVLWLHSVWERRALLRGIGELPAAKKLAALGRCVVAPWMIYGAMLAPLVYLACWPHLWPAPLSRFSAYVAFHLHHVHYNIEYLGTNYNRPPYPWHYVPVMTLLTTPVTVLVLSGLGLVLTWFSPRRRELFLLLLGILWPMLVIMRPGTPIFGAEKHWLPAMPFWAMLGGAGVAAISKRVQAAFLPASFSALRGLFAVGLGVAVIIPSLFEVLHSHPYGLSYYNALAAGPPGGADLGMNRQFWGYAVRGLMPTLNAVAPKQAAIYFHDANWPALQMSMKDGFLRRDLRDSGIEEPGVRAASLGLVIHEKHFNKYEYWLWDAFGTTRPLAVLTHEGVPLVTLYARP